MNVSSLFALTLNVELLTKLKLISISSLKSFIFILCFISFEWNVLKGKLFWALKLFMLLKLFTLFEICIWFIWFITPPKLLKFCCIFGTELLGKKNGNGFMLFILFIFMHIFGLRGVFILLKLFILFIFILGKFIPQLLKLLWFNDIFNYLFYI